MSTYVMSDFHGRYDLFRIMLNRIGFTGSDTLYVLGDVADRGPDGIRIFLYILDKPNIFLLAGNHEIMFLDAIRKASEFHTEHDFFLSREWLLWQYNGGEETWEAFKRLKESEQMAVIRFIEDACLVIPDLCVNGRDFYLCHSTHLLHYARDPLFLSDASDADILHAVWDRDYPGTKKGKVQFLPANYRELYAEYPRKMKMVFGHTPTGHLGCLAPDGRCRIYHGGSGHLIDIDCGCAACDPRDAMLGCLRLDDLREFYVPGNAREKRIRRVR